MKCKQDFDTEIKLCFKTLVLTKDIDPFSDDATTIICRCPEPACVCDVYGCAALIYDIQLSVTQVVALAIPKVCWCRVKPTDVLLQLIRI